MMICFKFYLNELNNATGYNDTGYWNNATGVTFLRQDFQSLTKSKRSSNLPGLLKILVTSFATTVTSEPFCGGLKFIENYLQ